MFKRFWMVLRSWFGAGIEKLEDPELLLQQAQEEMRTMHAKNRERAVQAITARNSIERMISESERKIKQLDLKAAIAERAGNSELARKYRRDQEEFQSTLAETKHALADAEQTARFVKREIRREDEKIREKTREALRLKAAWRQSLYDPSAPLPDWRNDPAAIHVGLLVTINLILLFFLVQSFLR